MTDSKRRDVLINVALATGIFLGLCVAAEVALRVVLLGKYNPFERDATLGVRLKSDYDGAYPRVRVRTDAHGRRIPADQNVDATGRFLFVGDSVTFGFSIESQYTFPILIADRLGERADATVAAVPGYNLEQVIGLMRENLARVRPEFVVYGLVVNDVNSALTPTTYEALDPSAARAAQGGLLSRSAFAAFLQRRLRRVSLRFITQPEPEQRADNVIRDYSTQLPRDADAAFRRQWRELEALQREADVPFYVFVAPYALQVDEEPGMRALQDYVAELCVDSPLLCIDPLDEFLDAAGEPLFTAGSSYHYNETGHVLMAEWLLEQLRQPGS